MTLQERDLQLTRVFHTDSSAFFILRGHQFFLPLLQLKPWGSLHATKGIGVIH